MEEPPSNYLPLLAREIHGFSTLADLDLKRLSIEARSRWFRPNEVHAILTNYSHCKLQPQPIDKPQSGTVLLYDRKVLRNFRKDGYNWRKKKDGKNVQEAHEKLKIGNEERIHVYYARSDDDPNFYRRSYWLLDKNMERIVLVHYRQTSELPTRRHDKQTKANTFKSSDSNQDSVLAQPPPAQECTTLAQCENLKNNNLPLTLLNSTTCSTHSELSGSAVCSEEINSGEDILYNESGLYQVNQRARMDNIYLNELGLDRLVEPHIYVDLNSHGEGERAQHEAHEHAPNNNQSSLLNDVTVQKPSILDGNETLNITADGSLVNQDSLGQWNFMNYGEQGLFDCDPFDTSIPNGGKSDELKVTDILSTQDELKVTDILSTQDEIFYILDVSPEWAYSTIETKVLMVGHFKEPYKHLTGSKVYCVVGKDCIAAEMIHEGAYRFTMSSISISCTVDFYVSLDGCTPISQVRSFEIRPLPNPESKGSNKMKKTLVEAEIRLAHLLFSTTNSLSTLSSKIQPKFLKEAKKYASLASPLMEKEWKSLLEAHDAEISDAMILVLKNKLYEWLLFKVAEGCRITPLDSEGQGVIHLCAILDYTWAVRLFFLSGLSLDFRDAFGWTALHWAAYFGRESMVAALLSAGANPSLVTDSTPENPAGCTAADLASKGGYEGLAGYLAEKGIAAHFKAMTLSGNISTPLQTSNNTVHSEYSQNLSEQEICLKESLAAYRNAADAANQIQAAFRERALKQQTRAVQLANPIMEAKQIVSALKIQHAFQNYKRRRLLKAASQIQSHFRTWQARKNFINMRRQAIKIQAVFRGHQCRKQYRKITWSVGVLEKAILRWRKKRKGLRGIQNESKQEMKVDSELEESAAEEDFFRIGREQAEERIRNSVVKVQSMFRSYQAQQEYRRMKLIYEKAQLEFNINDDNENQ